MKKRKGAALPGAIMLCIMLLAVSVTVSFLVVQSALSRRIESLQSGHRLEFETAYRYFIEHDGAAPTDTTLAFRYRAVGTGDQKALIGSTIGGEMRFYAIYDFSGEGKTLAYQTSDFYIYHNELDGKDYLGGILPLEDEA